MRKLIFVFLMIFLIHFTFAGQTTTLKELSRPAIFIVKYDKLYILEKTSIFIYSLKDFKLIKKFGRAGEGPREFKTSAMGAPMSMSIHQDKLVVNSLNKLSFFSKEGDFIEEIKNPLDGLLFLIKDRYVGIGPAPGENNKFFISFRLFGDDFKQQKILYQSDFDVNNPRELLLPLPNFTYNPVYKKKIYITSSSTEFIIDVYGADGQKEHTIKKDFQKIPIPEKYKQETHEWFKNDLRFKPYYESRLKNIIKFRDYFQPIRNIQIVDDTVHVITYKRKNDLWECILLDLKGNEKNRVFVPLDAYVPFTYYPILYSVYQEKMYTLIEDENDEVWKVHITELK